MREILFRGKTVESGEWVEGVPYRFNTPGLEGKVAMILDYGPNVRYINAVGVNPDTVGQFTGMTDKNGVKIFEGDIVRKRVYEGIRNREVVFSFGTFHCGWGSGSSTAMHPYLLDDKNIQVIGNVHDNPELLNVSPAAARRKETE